jgi:hypothetical protein
VHRHWRGADRDDVIERHRQRVLRDAVVVRAAGDRAHRIGNKGLRAEAFGDRCEVELAAVDHVGRLPARRGDLDEAMAHQIAGGGRRSLLREDLQRIDAG